MLRYYLFIAAKIKGQLIENRYVHLTGKEMSLKDYLKKCQENFKILHPTENFSNLVEQKVASFQIMDIFQ